MTLWINDGTDEGFYASCDNCPFAVVDGEDAEFVCGFDPPVAMRTPGSPTNPAGIPAWSQPLVRGDMHCHNHPAVWRAMHGTPVAARGILEIIKRPGDAEASS